MRLDVLNVCATGVLGQGRPLALIQSRHLVDYVKLWAVPDGL